MPKFACRCGEWLRYGEIPCPIEWLAIPDVEYDAVTGPVDAEALYARFRSLLRCPRCGRLWAFWDGFQQPPVEYVPAGR